jgi:hypothetical protein
LRYVATACAPLPRQAAPSRQAPLCCVLRVAPVRVECCIDAHYLLHRRRAAVPQRSRRVMRCKACCTCALLDWARVGLLRWPSDGVMHSWQSYGGGVISMVKGTALFDAVAISGTESAVRAGRGVDASRADARGAGVGERGARADCKKSSWLRRLCAGKRRRGSHGRWGRHVPGRLDLKGHGGA